MKSKRKRERRFGQREEFEREKSNPWRERGNRNPWREREREGKRLRGLRDAADNNKVCLRDAADNNKVCLREDIKHGVGLGL